MGATFKIKPESKKAFIDAIKSGLSTVAINSVSGYNSTRIRLAQDKYTPKRYGSLRVKSTQTVSNNGKTCAVLKRKYMQPYAEKQFTTQFRNYTTPGTGPRWDIKSESEVIDIVKEAIVSELKKQFG